ncbi:ankyrin repeat-containing domain protein [Aspergillus cavernicola]|uniref:Ankyrin repeat-containing domain protein n=1 Tax=Aspergillus cavernicola TaxID=176166 RepID=A0ABR4J2V0_9EURO
MKKLQRLTRWWSKPPPEFPIWTLPLEILFIIAESLPLEDVARLTQTSHFFAHALEPYLYAHAATHLLARKPRMILDWAAEKDRLSVLEKIRTYGKHTGDRLTVIPLKCKTRALSLAAKQGHTAAAELLLNMGAEINQAVPIEDSYHFTALHRAARRGHIGTATFLLDNGADLNIHGTPSESAVLEYAARWGQTEMVLLLLSRGADIKTPSLLANAVFSENIDLVRTLLNRGGEINGSWHCRLSAIHWAMPYSKPNIPMLKLLLERGIDPDIGDFDRDNTALHWAAGEGDVEVVKLLLEHGADVNIADNLGHRPLHCVAERTDGGGRERQKERVLQMLLDAGADVLATDDEGNSALDFAESAGWPEMTNLLVIAANGVEGNGA